MRIQLVNEFIHIAVAGDNAREISSYLVVLLNSNHVNGYSHFDHINNEFIINGYGDNLNIYHALLQIQEESVTEYYTI